jgi:hypothetical protein
MLSAASREEHVASGDILLVILKARLGVQLSKVGVAPKQECAMLERKKPSQAVIDETRDAIQEARLAIRRSRQMLARMKEPKLSPDHQQLADGTRVDEVIE